MEENQMKENRTVEKIREVGSSRVTISDSFWRPMQEKVIDVVIPFQEKC